LSFAQPVELDDQVADPPVCDQFGLRSAFVGNLLKINLLLVEAAGVEPVTCTENAQVTETKNA
jgi:hypothetical protein